MKKILFASLISICIHSYSHAQTLQDSSASKKLTARELGMQYLHKSRALNLTGFVMLAAGTAAVIGGSAGVSNHLFDEGGDGYATLMVAGMFVGLGSVPFFISAANFKGKASILLHYENILGSYQTPMKTTVASVGIAFPIK